MPSSCDVSVSLARSQCVRLEGQLVEQRAECARVTAAESAAAESAAALQGFRSECGGLRAQVEELRLL